MVTVQLGSDSIRGELIYAPFPEGDHVQLTGSDWSLIQPGILEDAVAALPTWDGADNPFLEGTIRELSNGLSTLEPSTQRGLSGAFQSVGTPEDFGYQGNIAGRIEVEAPGFDAALVGGNLRNSIPRTRLSTTYRDMLKTQALPAFDQFETLASETPLESEWPRTWMAGAEVSSVVGPIGIRAEGGWWSDKVVQQTWLDSSTAPMFASGLGLDYAHGSSLFVAIEGRWQHLLTPVSRPFLIRSNVVEFGTTIRLSMLNDRVQVQGAGLFNATFNEWLARPELRWVTSDTVSLSVGAVIIDGAVGPPTDLASALSYQGGPLSLLSENDSVFVSMRWTR
jgi:hypothetical protein